MQLEIVGKEYFLLIKSGNIFLRTDMINNNNLIVSSYFYNEIVLDKIKNNLRASINVIGADNKEIEEKMKENDIKHSLVRELELRERKIPFGGNSISISPEIYDLWTSTLQTTQIVIKIEGLEEKVNVGLNKDPKLTADVIALPSSIVQKIRIRDRKVVNGEKIVVYPEII